MRSLILVLTITIAGALLAGPASAAEPTLLQTSPWLNEKHLSLPVSELAKLVPAGAPALALATGPSSFFDLPGQGPDLVPHVVSWSRYGSGRSLGFPRADFAGWRADWTVKNRGDQTAGPPPWKVRIKCEVRNATGELRTFLEQRWCSFGAGTFDVTTVLEPNGTTPTGLLKVFVGYPLFACHCATCPDLSLVVEADSASNIDEPGRESNNVVGFKVCGP